MKPRKPTKPTQPKGVTRSSGAGRRGRPVGYKTEYTPEQTARYKSQALRYAKALELANAGPDFVQFNGQTLSSDDAANLRNAGGEQFKPTDRVNFRWVSQRSGLDYWTVTYGGGGLEDVSSFSDVITLTGTETCPEPVVTWSWENPKFDWAADGIKVCEGEAAQPPGQSSYTVPPYFPGTYSPVPPGQNRLVTFTLTSTYTDIASQSGCGLGNGSTYTDPPYVQSFSRYMTDTDTLESFVDAGSFAGIEGLPGTYGYVGYSLTGFHLNGLTGFQYSGGSIAYGLVPPLGSTEINCSVVYFSSHVSNFTVQLSSPDGFLISPPPGMPPPFPPGVPPPAVSPFPAAAALAGGTFTSITFIPTADVAVKATLDYTTVPDIGDITGAIAVQLYADSLLVDSFSQTPTNGGTGALEHTFSLTAGLSYYFKIVIPETCYCDTAKVAIGGGGFACDCPDFTKFQEFSYNSSYNSEQTVRDWSTSAAGCNVDDGCKHIIGSKLFLGIPYEVPLDIPL